MQLRLRHVFLAIAAAFLSAAASTSAGAQQATTTGAVRGTVRGPDDAPIAGASVVAINDASGTRRGTQTDDRGRYNIPFLNPGIYTVRATRLGYRPAERTGMRSKLGQIETQDFKLETAATQLGAVVVNASAVPLIESTKSGTSTRILEEQLRQLPTSDRNFKNLVVLTPGASDIGPSGAGGGQSLGGGRTASSNLLMDGVNNNESFFGGDARGGDRLPFSYSIEAVKEIQVITAGYDVERGQFTGGTVNAVTKSGTNKFQGSVFDYERGDKRFGVKLTGRDFLDRVPRNYLREQYGLSLGGPIIKDKLHFFFTLDRQVGNEPKPVLQTGTDAASIRTSGINADTLAKLLGIVALTSIFSTSVSNELRGQVSHDRKPRPSNPSVLGGIIPQVRINGIVANPGDNLGNVTTAVIFGADPVLHANNLEQDTYELIDNLRFTRDRHTYKLGTDLNKVHVFNDFFFNGLGSFTFNNLTDFANKVPASYTRALPFTPTSGNPIALFDVYEAAFYAQDEWQVSPKLFVTYGLRYDISRYPDKAKANPILASGPLALRNDQDITDNNNIAPRFGFTPRTRRTSRRHAWAAARRRRARDRPCCSRRTSSRRKPGRRTSPTTGCSRATGG